MSLLLDALRQAEKNKALAGSTLAVEEMGESAGPLSLMPQDTPDTGPDERIEIALIPAFDLTPAPAGGGLQGLDNALQMILADAAGTEPALATTAFYKNNNHHRQAVTASPADEANPGFSPHRDFMREEAAAGSPATSEPAGPAQDDRQLAESVLLAAQPPSRPASPPSRQAYYSAGPGGGSGILAGLAVRPGLYRPCSNSRPASTRAHGSRNARSPGVRRYCRGDGGSNPGKPDLETTRTARCRAAPAHHCRAKSAPPSTEARRNRRCAYTQAAGKQSCKHR